MAENQLLITESRFDEVGKPTGTPREGEPSPVHRQVYVGNDEDGWVSIPRVLNVDLPLRQGDLPKAIITVLFPVVDLKGKKK